MILVTEQYERFRSVIHATKTASDGVLVAPRQHQKSFDTDQDDLEGRLQGAATAQRRSHLTRHLML
jgi:hypothetical protein